MGSFFGSEQNSEYGSAKNIDGDEDEDEKDYKDAMADEGVADWTLQREQQKFMFRKQQRIKNNDVAFLMKVKSRLEFKSQEEQIKYCKAKLKDLAFNDR